MPGFQVGGGTFWSPSPLTSCQMTGWAGRGRGWGTGLISQRIWRVKALGESGRRLNKVHNTGAKPSLMLPLWGWEGDSRRGGEGRRAWSWCQGGHLDQPWGERPGSPPPHLPLRAPQIPLPFGLTSSRPSTAFSRCIHQVQKTPIISLAGSKGMTVTNGNFWWHQGTVEAITWQTRGFNGPQIPFYPHIRPLPGPQRWNAEWVFW